MKLHLGCGDVYLRGYVNIDINGTLGVSPDARDFEDYYSGRTIGYEKERYVDCICDVRRLPFENAEEIVAVQLLEHFPESETVSVLSHWYSALKEGGKLIVDVPDIVGTFNADISDEWKMRLIYGSHKNEYSTHKTGFTKEILSRKLREAGFSDVRFRQIIGHNYPSLTAIATK